MGPIATGLGEIFMFTVTADPTAKNEEGQYLFTRDEMAAMFYVALSQHLSRTSNFRQCRAAMELAVKSLFRGVPPEEIKARVEAVSTAYEVTGIIGELSAG